MRRLVLAAALAFGCDDPVVEERVLDILVNGGARAQSECTGTVSDRSVRYRATLMQDGSCLAETNVEATPLEAGTGTGSDATVWLFSSGFSARSASDADECPVWTRAGFGRYVRVVGGDVLFHTTALSSQACTGFNLEALGLE